MGDCNSQSQDGERRFCGHGRSAVILCFGWSVMLLLGSNPSCNAYVFPSSRILGHRARTVLSTHLTASPDTDDDTTVDTVRTEPPKLRLDQKPKQKRRKMRHPRRPKDYWSDCANLDAELRSFWTDLRVPQRPHRPPTVPSEALLNHFQRHDLRYAIANAGGRLSVAHKLGGASVVPGDWREAVEECEEVGCLLDPGNPAGVGLNRDLSPITTCRENTLDDQGGNIARWAHRSGRKPKNYWNQTVVIQELYDYLALVKEKKGRPSVWMPRPSELGKEGRNDLKQAIARHGGAKRICALSRLVPYHEWRYFESQLELYTRLRTYLTSTPHHPPTLFPRLADIRTRDERLYDLVLEFGGRTMLAAKLDMETTDGGGGTRRPFFGGMRFGAFDLDFAVRLLRLVRGDMMDGDPPADRPRIAMPTRGELEERGEVRLAEEVWKYGGHENIARRLGLGLRFDG